MPSEVITNVNWIDILLIIATIRIIYIGSRRGFVVELSKIAGLVVGAVVAFHYYIGLSDFVVARSPLPTGFSDLFCFVFLLIIVILLFRLFREGLGLLIKVEPLPFVNTGGGFLLGAL